MSRIRKINHLFLNLAISFLSIILIFLSCEAVARLFFNRTDYLIPKLLKDDFLGRIIKPNSAGHDTWGYRNRAVPKTAEIVTIGDSTTYGISATEANSWPSLLKKLCRKRIYNLSLGGYGPVEYFYLLENKALGLKPSLIIVGFYYGNDIYDTYHSVYNNDHWKKYRKHTFDTYEKNEMDTIFPENNDVIVGRLRKIRTWLASNSILYGILRYSKIGELARRSEINKSVRSNKKISMLEDKYHNIFTAFTPKSRLLALDKNDPKIIEGMHICFELFSKMNEICIQNKIRFLVLLVPTKESVFSEYIKKNNQIYQSNILDELINSEKIISEEVMMYFDKANISYINLLPILQNYSDIELIYPNNQDGHPNKNGYMIIAQTVCGYLSKISAVQL